MRKEAALGELPEWDLADLYPGTESDELKGDIAAMKAATTTFQDSYKDRVATLDGAALAEAVAEYERIQEVLGRIGSYSYLVYAGNMADPVVGRFFQSMQEVLNEISTRLIFFSLEINRIEDDALGAKYAESAALRHYEPWLRDVRLFRDHDLSDEIERILHAKSVSGRNAWVRLFDETLASLVFEVDGERLGLEETLHLLSDSDGAARKKAAKALGTVFAANNRLFALITNTLARDKQTEDEWRHYPAPESARHLANQVEPEVVDALTKAVTDAYPKLSHRYYTWKAKQFGVEQIDYWDRNAPLPGGEDKLIGWPEARDIVLDAYGRFSPDLAAIGKRFFDNAWIDAPARKGKAPGAFAHPTVPAAHPYLLLNYQGRTRDVMTLAHELGHGVHQVLAGPQGALMSSTPLTLAETASVFGEQLTFRALLERETDPARRRLMLAGKVEDMLNTVVRQIAFYRFEQRVHGERREGELLPDRIGDIWMEVQTESLGPGIRFHEEYRNFWCYVPHFIHSPFYVYAYAFGDCLVNALYAVYQQSESGFQEKYFEMLKAGGTRRHKELLAPFGLDASDPAFWSLGLDVIESFIDELTAA
ncbi:M3 family oligoendopeptidase [Oceanibacterium hippocampi]|uniref:Oligoendopeptidase F, plasmid n=1 Tax=Oceanibacterium hippocampi TaxID=745714 RepID=A0A1Y5S9F5_9PROT|nr:M3 family oligoendopeptidase [Oceanibacterium hippocampi]SLN35408.1 Oligoendopeptidase F, plasmid [Oceanibacterium hippocampi]